MYRLRVPVTCIYTPGYLSAIVLCHCALDFGRGPVCFAQSVLCFVTARFISFRIVCIRFVSYCFRFALVAFVSYWLHSFRIVSFVSYWLNSFHIVCIRFTLLLSFHSGCIRFTLFRKQWHQRRTSHLGPQLGSQFPANGKRGAS